MNRASFSYRTGFTIVELLIVIVVIAILAAVSVVAYVGIQERANNASIQSTISQLQKRLELYKAQNDGYPITVSGSMGGNNAARTDANCSRDNPTLNWIPGFDDLPQGSFQGTGVDSRGGCYMYVSDGASYVLSAWNALRSPQTSTFYRRVGFREMTTANMRYICNYNRAGPTSQIGGIAGGVYSATKDYYKYSYTVSNITSCDETSPVGA